MYVPLNKRIFYNLIKSCRRVNIQNSYCVKRNCYTAKFRVYFCCYRSNALLNMFMYRSFSSDKFTDICSSYNDDEEEIYDDAYEDLVQRTFRTREMGHQVFVIQPYIKWGPLKKNLTKPDYQLAEAAALIDTLDGWSVVDSLKISLSTFKKTKFFGTGNLDTLQERIRKNAHISAVFVSVNRLTYVQQDFLEDTFGVPVYDRYNIVVQIFHRHAVSKEAKLQVAMAEIPFMWYRIKRIDDKGGGGASYTSGSGETYLELKKRILTDKEQKIKRQLKKLEKHRTLLRSNRKKKEFPLVAVVGYTNAGKTSLIKALTAAENLEPRNQLFATLDVTVHEGTLPSNIKTLYVDTIGFISDIPTELIEPFTVTLEDAVQSDVLVHVMDISNPDIVAQAKHVIETLQRLKLNNKLITNIINVANKCDLVSDSNIDVIHNLKSNLEGSQVVSDIIEVSCTENIGLNHLLRKIENVVLKMTGRLQIKIRVKNGGPEFMWLYKESSVVNLLTDVQNPDFIYIDVIITETNLMKFKHIFINSKRYHSR